MGIYLNPDSNNFKRAINSEIYVDKTGLLSELNRRVNTQQCYICVSRPRRFGKSMATDMIAAYYNCDCNNDELFREFEIYKDASYTKYLSKFLVIKIDMQSFMSSADSMDAMLFSIIKSLRMELSTYSATQGKKDIYDGHERIWELFDKAYQAMGRQFVIVIDEWDCVMRRYHSDVDKKKYLDFMRNWMKDQPYIALAYMTGILPVKKYGEHSTLNVFDEYSMMNGSTITPYFGFVESEVMDLCDRYDMNFEDAREWYDGYHFVQGAGQRRKEYSVYSPKSVVDAMLNGCFDNYWSKTESYEALKKWIQMDFDGVKAAILEMLAGNAVPINTRSFQNDMDTFHNRDDVLTLLVHLGYLAFSSEEKTVRIPNKEIAEEFVTAIEYAEEYSDTFAAVAASKKLLEALLNGDEEAVAVGVEKAHQLFSSIQYNNENALSCVIELAFYYAREYYMVFREMPSGIGFADICYLPKRKCLDKPAIIIELKWNKEVQSAIDQIRDRNYPERLKGYENNLILCGISYEKNMKESAKKHTCIITTS